MSDQQVVYYLFGKFTGVLTCIEIVMNNTFLIFVLLRIKVIDPKKGILGKL